MKRILSQWIKELAEFKHRRWMPSVLLVRSDRPSALPALAQKSTELGFIKPIFNLG